MWKRNCVCSVCEGGTAGFEAKALVWERNFRMSSLYISGVVVEPRNFQALFLVRKRNCRS